MKIRESVHLLESTKGSFVYLVLGEEPLLIDTGHPGRSNQILSELKNIGMDPSDIAHILLTHHDVDHIGNAKALQAQTGATLWAPREDVPYIHGEENPRGIRRLIKKLVKVDNPTITNTYEAGQRIGEVEIIPTPGHTLGHVSVLYKDTLFAGDLVMSRKGKLQAPPKFLNVDKGKLKDSMKNVGSLKFDWVCPAHGLPVARGNLWDALVK